MPIVPRISERSIEPQGIPNARLNPSAVPSVSMDKSFDAAERILNTEMQKMDQLAFLEYDSKLSQATNNLQVEAQKRQGKDALNIQPVLDSYDQYVTEIDKTLSNDNQRMAAKRSALYRRVALDKDLKVHAANEGRKFDDETSRSHITNEYDAALINYKDPERISLSVDRINAVIQDHAKRNGLPDEYITKTQRESVSKVHKGVIERMLVNDEDLLAKDYYTQNIGAFTGGDKIYLEDKLNTASINGEANRIADDVWVSLKPTDDNSPVNIDQMEEAVIERTKNLPAEVRDKALTVMGGRVSRFNAAQNERAVANEGALYEMNLSDTPIEDIRKSPEYINSSGRVKENFERVIKTQIEHDTDRKYTLKLREYEGLSQSEADNILAKATSLDEAVAQSTLIEDPKLRDLVENRIEHYYSRKGTVEEKARAEASRSIRGKSQKKADEIFKKYTTFDAALAESRKITDPELRDATEQRIEHAFAIVNKITMDDRIAQAQTFSDSVDVLESLTVQDIHKMYAKREIDSKQRDTLVKMKDAKNPMKSSIVQSSLKRLNQARTDNIFFADDSVKNDEAWQNSLTKFNNYVLEHHTDTDYDPKTFMDDLLAEVETGFIDKVLDWGWFGAEGTEKAKEKKYGIGTSPKPVQPKPAGKPAQTHPLSGKPAGRYKVNGKVLKWDGNKEIP